MQALMHRALAVIASATVGVASVTTPVDAASKTTLPQRLEQVVQRMGKPGCHLGISVVRLDNGEVVFTQDADKLYTPASLIKVATVGAALNRIDPDTRFATRLLSDALLDEGTLRGPLFLQGMGDPELGVTQLVQLATQLKARGVRVVAGDLVADATALQPESRAADGWMVDDLPWGYAASPAALCLNSNALAVTINAGAPGQPPTCQVSPASDYIRVRNLAVTGAPGAPNTLKVSLERSPRGPQEILNLIGTVPAGAKPYNEALSINDPVAWTLTIFAECLKRQGIRHDGSLKRGAAPQSARELATNFSQPFGEICRQTLKRSDNVWAEMILLQLGKHSFGAPGTRSKGLRALDGYLKSAGWPDGGYRLSDGAGLSRYNLLSPTMMTGLLRAMSAEKGYPTLLIGLPTAGIDGTLGNRLRNVAARGRLRAKTGTLGGVSGLAGFVEGRDGAQYAIAIIANSFTGDPNTQRQLQDALVMTLIDWNTDNPSDIEAPVADEAPIAPQR
jgi:D-alanyl-D-alanine carboxypeptidase/D-alanyl-D-alanine-endopeptidase (penicillin-binding protein 4)